MTTTYSRKFILALNLLLILFISPQAKAQEGGSSLEIISKSIQDPLASIFAINFDNTISFGTGDNDDTAFNFQIQGIYAIPTSRINFVPRVILPIVGAPKGSDLPILEPGGGGPGTTWGLGDTIAQVFVSPVTKSNWKWGIGPQLSFPTHTDPDLKGPDWGAGPAAVILGDVGQWSLGAVGGNLWSFDGDFNTLLIQPLVYYNVASVPGLSFSYSPAISADWEIDSSDRWTLPLGASVGKTFLLGTKGHAVDLSVGGFGVPIRPDGGPKAQLKVGIFFVFPR